ncbi:MAG: DUF1905 domain-containing protein [Lachnospiraceae bacterium]|nr:DUF1905 domain-containing protein [Lachnospiraceae bacterium]
MYYQFKGKVTSQDGKSFIKIPFNVWEVCDTQGTLRIEGDIDGNSFECEPEPLGKGMYVIPVSGSVADALKGNEEQPGVRFTIPDRKAYMGKESPYSVEAPIRKIDSMKLITQPNDGLCGQTCIAMLAGITLDDACEVMHCRDWQASMGKMVDTLDYLGLTHSDTIIYTQGSVEKLPKCAILMEKMGRYSHYLVIYDGTFFDPTEGIIDDFDMDNLVGYLEIDTF